MTPEQLMLGNRLTEDITRLQKNTSILIGQLELLKNWNPETPINISTGLNNGLTLFVSTENLSQLIENQIRINGLAQEKIKEQFKNL